MHNFAPERGIYIYLYIFELYRPLLLPRRQKPTIQIPSGPNTRIVNGYVAEEGEVSWQVLLIDMNYGMMCGGSIINRLFVLTANHCNVNDWIPCNDMTKEKIGRCKKKRNESFGYKPAYTYPSNILGIF